MEKTGVQKLAKVLRWLVIFSYIVVLIAMAWAPGITVLLVEGGPEMVRRAFLAALEQPGYEGQGFSSLSAFMTNAVWAVWLQLDTALLILTYWLWGICALIILRQARKVLDTILKSQPFQLSNARCLKWAAVCCWIIAGSALVRMAAGLWVEENLKPLFAYNTLFIPVFFMAGLLFMVMSALFRQAAELKEDQDLTI